MIKLKESNWSISFSGNVKIYFQGHCFSDKKLILNAESFFLELLAGKQIDDQLIFNIFSKIVTSGKFACIVAAENKTYLVTDIIRSQPLHIVKKENQLEVVDILNNDNQLPLDQNMVNIYVSAGFTYGPGNCFSGVYSLQAAEIVTLEGMDINSQRYFKYIPEKTGQHRKENELINDFDKQMEVTIDRMLKSAPKVNNWVLPLSGGHDSRMLVNYLYKAGVKNVICFSYGTCNNLQSRLSEQVAKAAGYDWYFVEYTDEKWDRLNKEGIVDDYIDFSFQGVSTPHLQDFLAVYELKEAGIIKEGDIFVPGHSGITGIGYTEETARLKNEEEGVLFCFNKCFKTRVSKVDKVPQFFKDILIDSSMHPSEYFAYLNWKGRQTKFIANSIRVYEFFGFESRLPFWDKSFVEFWLSLSPIQRSRRNFMLKAEKHGILLEKFRNIPFVNELRPGSKGKITEKIKEIIPNFITIALLRISGKKKKVAEGLNRVHAKRGKHLKDILWPLEDFPVQTYNLIKPKLRRYPYQINVHYLSNLLAVRRAYDYNRKIEDNQQTNTGIKEVPEM